MSKGLGNAGLGNGRAALLGKRTVADAHQHQAPALEQPRVLDRPLIPGRGPGRPAIQEELVPKSLRISKELNKRLKRYCVERERSEVEVLREIIENYLAEQGF